MIDAVDGAGDARRWKLAALALLAAVVARCAWDFAPLLAGYFHTRFKNSFYQAFRRSHCSRPFN